MVIDKTTYVLSVDNYIPIISNKTQIIIGHTSNNNMKHFIGWKHRYNGLYKKTAPYTITKSGIIYQHFDPKYSSKYFIDKKMNDRSVIILLENDGWLSKDIEKNVFITWVGDIYNTSSEVVEKKWRGHTYWSKYTTEQIQSTQELVKMIANEFSIPLTSISHNTKIDKLVEHEGVIYNSNLDKNKTDLNPSWDFESFKNKIELT